MGVNKAFLTIDGRTLAEIAASAVQWAAGSVTLVGDPDVYAKLGYPVIPDTVEGAGPLAGIRAALEWTSADWNLIAACDMPNLQPALLRSLLDEAADASATADCLLPETSPGRLEPLCAVYHRRCLPKIASELQRGTRKVTAALQGMRIRIKPFHGSAGFANLNTPLDWDEHLGRKASR